mgnify:CR=1 FL=1
MPETKDITLSPSEKKEILKEYRQLLGNVQFKLRKRDTELIRQAFEMAIEYHAGMRRKSGEPYIFHPLAVARIVSEEIGLETTSIVCALLHDTIEDTELTLEDVENAFDKNTAKIINGLTKISGVFDLNSSIQAENFRKMLLTLNDDVRVILIKIADRLHNMQTMDAMPDHKQVKIASETLYIYAPLAHRLGLYNIKTELEDLGLKYTEPEVFLSIVDKIKESKEEQQNYLKRFSDKLKSGLDKENFTYDIKGRFKKGLNNKLLGNSYDLKISINLSSVKFPICNFEYLALKN